MEITWTAKNNSSFLNGHRSAKTMRGAVRAARNYIRGELYGEGVATIYVDGHPARQEERSIYTKFEWVTRTDF